VQKKKAQTIGGGKCRIINTRAFTNKDKQEKIYQGRKPGGGVGEKRKKKGKESQKGNRDGDPVEGWGPQPQREIQRWGRKLAIGGKRNIPHSEHKILTSGDGGRAAVALCGEEGVPIWKKKRRREKRDPRKAPLGGFPSSCCRAKRRR